MVFVLDKHHKPLMPCTEKRARILLQQGRAVVHSLDPFRIRIKDLEAKDCRFQPLRLKLDPGSKDTGVAVILEGARGSKVLFLGEIVHKPGIKESLDARRALRRGRRNRKTRYRQARFRNRNPEKCIVCGRNARHGHVTCRQHSKERPGTPVVRHLPPSLRARVDQTMSAVARLQKGLSVTVLTFEQVKFDTQLLQNPEISGAEYQRGELLGYETREYLLEKFGHTCAYCDGESGESRLEVEHIVPKSRGGTNRVSNLTIACHVCNQDKNDRNQAEWARDLVGSKKEIDQRRVGNCATVQARAQAPLRDAAVMNATRWALLARLRDTGWPVETGTGARTEMQRIAHVLPKEHYFDALCVGESTPEVFASMPAYSQIWTATGRGSRQICGTDRHGFPIRHRSRRKAHFGFQTGDLVVALVPEGKYAGIWRGRVLVRASGYFDIKAGGKRVAQGVSYRCCRVLQRASGWQFEKQVVSKEARAAASSA